MRFSDRPAVQKCPAGDHGRRASGLGIVENGAVAARDGRIAYAGPEAELPGDSRNAAEIVDCEGRWITPGLIDCHTHLVHAGDRAAELEMRLKGATYEEIARAGGGILSTVTATRAASEDELVASGAAAPRCADRRRRDDGRDQVRLRARRRERSEDAARRDPARRRARRRRRPHLPRRACAAAGSGRRQGSLHRRRSAASSFRDRRGRACRRGRRLLRGDRLLAEQIARVFDAARAHRPAGEAARRAAFQSRRREARGALWRALRRSSRISRRGRAWRRWQKPARSPCFCPARSIS